jgi:putrescine transport system substrate-binding protein
MIPKEGSDLWFSMVAIPKDAPNAANAHLFINYLMDLTCWHSSDQR